METFSRADMAFLTTLHQSENDRAGHGVYLEQDTLYRALMQEWFDRVQEVQRQPEPA